MFISPDESINYCGENAYQIEIEEIINALISHLKWKYEKLSEVPSQFSFLRREKLFSMNTSDLQKASNDLAHNYSDDLNPVEISSEIVKQHEKGEKLSTTDSIRNKKSEQTFKSEERELVIKEKPIKRSPGPGGFTGQLY